MSERSSALTPCRSDVKQEAAKCICLNSADVSLNTPFDFQKYLLNLFVHFMLSDRLEHTHEHVAWRDDTPVMSQHDWPGH